MQDVGLSVFRKHSYTSSMNLIMCYREDDDDDNFIYPDSSQFESDMQDTTTRYIPVRTCRVSHFLTTKLEPRHGILPPHC
jgi:hypothetical protein